MTKTTSCPSNWALERYLLGELLEASSDVVHHVAVCDICRAKIVAQEADSMAFMASPAAAEVRRLLSLDQPKRNSDRRDGKRSVPMRRALAVVGAAAALALIGALWRPDGGWRTARPGAAKSEEQVVLRFQNEWMEAVRDKDAVALERILADDYTYTDTRGTVSNKADSLHQARTAGDGLTAFSTSEAKARVYGDVAVVTGRVRVEGVSGGKAYETEVQFTDTLARIGGRWRAVAAHVSRPGPSSAKER